MRLLAAVAAVIAAVALGAPAHAGVLSKVVHGMKQKSGQTGRNEAASSGEDDDSSSDGSDSDWGDSYSRCGSCEDDPTSPIVGWPA